MTTSNLLISTAILEEEDNDLLMSSSSSSSSEDLHSAINSSILQDDVTAQLAAAGPIGLAAAAAITSTLKRRRRPHSFETNPSIRKRQQTRLLRKLHSTIDEFTLRVGMQAVVLVTIPGKQNNCYKCFGAKPLEDVVKNLRPVVMQDLEGALAVAAPLQVPDDPSLHELPALVIDGIPTPVEKMTQAQLRAFIPLMLKYSTGRGKPGWGKESTRPGWWPGELPWANVRMDARSEDDKQKVSWTHALRQIVINCYKYHGREDLLPVFSGEQQQQSEDNQDLKPNKYTKISSSPSPSSSQQQTLSPEKMYQICEYLKQQEGGGKVLQAINLDGSVSLINVEGGSVVAMGGGSELPQQQQNTVNIDLSQLALNSQQLIITGEDGRAYPVTVSGMISVPLQEQQQQQQQNIFTTATNSSIVQQQQQVQIVASAPPPSAIVPKLEPPEQLYPNTIPLSALTGDPNHGELLTVSSTGQVVHDGKVYQICEYGQQEEENEEENEEES